MINDENKTIDMIFKKEIGLNIYTAIDILNKTGITLEDMGEMTNELKNTITNEVEKRKIPYEYRFLLLNVILCTMFKTTVAYYKEYIRSLRDLQEKGIELNCER